MNLRKADVQALKEYPDNWKDIPGFEGYAAYHKGAILNRTTNYVLKNTVFKNGYVYITVKIGGIEKSVRVHRLIALAFHPNPENKPEVNHLYGIKTDLHSANLEWATPSENKKHAFAIGLMKVKRPQLGKFNSDSARSRPVNQYDLTGNLIKKWPSVAEAGRSGYSAANISAVCNGRRTSSNGFNWKY